ncbi:alpha-1,4 glucan phosphorylase L isozyme, chloroplastic/amyloplastic isoform X2, partial [Tanacetum coccineum]
DRIISARNNRELSLDMCRDESSRQHVRALKNQFTRGVLRFQSAAHIHIRKPLLMCLYMHLYKGINGREQSRCTKELLSETRALNGRLLRLTKPLSVLDPTTHPSFVFSTSTDGKIKAWLYGNICSRVSTTGLEASGTSNMKFDMNGCIQIGTLDGANVEIRQEVGEDNFFLFGDEAHKIDGLQKERSEGKFVPDPILEEVKEYLSIYSLGTGVKRMSIVNFRFLGYVLHRPADRVVSLDLMIVIGCDGTLKMEVCDIMADFCK